jgi:hypothetical protein
MNVSNKTLGLFLVAAIVVSVGGTFFSLDKLDDFSSTGYASGGSGDVNLVIDTSLSIVLTDNGIDFGTCLLTGGTMTFDSSLDDDGVNNSACTAGTFPDSMTIENDGNVVANITVQTDALLVDEYDFATGSSMEFKSEADESPCGDVVAWTTFATKAVDQTVCDNFKTAAAEDSFDFFIRITLPDTTLEKTASDNKMGLTFTAVTA